MQGYVDDYLRTGKVDGIWMTEDHGRAGKGPVTVMERGFRFMAWVARNKLDADQARLVWWGDGARKPGGSAREAEQILGDFLCGRTLYFLDRSGDDGHIYVISDGVDTRINRILVALFQTRIPASTWRMSDLACQKISRIRDGLRTQSSFPPPILPDQDTLRPVAADEAELRVSIGNSVTEPMLLLLRQPKQKVPHDRTLPCGYSMTTTATTTRCKPTGALLVSLPALRRRSCSIRAGKANCCWPT